MNNEPPRVVKDADDFDKHTSFMIQETLKRVQQFVADKRAGRWVCWITYGKVKPCTAEQPHSYCEVLN